MKLFTRNTTTSIASPSLPQSLEAPVPVSDGEQGSSYRADLVKKAAAFLVSVTAAFTVISPQIPGVREQIPSEVVKISDAFNELTTGLVGADIPPIINDNK